jgi:hypothetical protein
MRPGSVTSEEGDSLMAALLTFQRTNLARQERWKLLIPPGDCPVSARNCSELAQGQRFVVKSW